MATTGLRDYFQNQGYNVDYNNDNGQINVTNPTNKQSVGIGSQSYQNTNGTAYIDPSFASNLQQQLGKVNTPSSPGALSSGAPNTNGVPSIQDLFMQAASRKPTQIDTGSLWNNASNRVNQIYSQFQNRINGQVSRLDANRNSVMNHLNTNLDNQKQDLGDTTFRNYMAANDQKVKRGIGGMGLANDLDTRVALANNESLKQLDRQYNDQAYAANQNYDANYGTLQDQLSSFDYSGKLNDAYQELYSNALKAKEAEKDPLTEAFKTFAPYMFQNADTKANNAEKMYEFSNISASDKAKMIADAQKSMLPYQYQTLDNAANNETSLTNKKADIGLGYDKLKQTAYDNAADRNLKWDINATNLAEKKDEFSYSLDMKAKTLQNTAYNQQAQQQATLGKNYVSVANQAAERIKQYTSTNQPVPEELQKAYDEAMYNAKTANDNLAKLVGSAGGNSNFQTTR